MNIYSELNRKQLKQLEDGMDFVLPEGISLDRKEGSRACYFSCDNDSAYGELIELLDDNNMLWQNNGE